MPSLFQTGVKVLTSLTGAERFRVDNGGAVMAVTPLGLTFGSACSSAFSLANSTVLAPVAGMNNTVVVAGTYIVDIYLAVTSGASGGIKVNLGAGGTAVASSFICDSWAYNTTTVAAEANTTVFNASQVAYTGAVTTITIQGVLVISASGTVVLEVAQNASNGTATTVAVGSYMTFNRIA